MSRIGRAPVFVDSSIQVNITSDNVVEVKGSKTTLKVPMRTEVKAKFEDGQITFTRSDDSKSSRGLHGLYRALVQNAVTGVSKGFSKTLILNGVGYRSALKGKEIELNLGYSHAINFPIPAGIEVKIEKATTLIISGADKALVGQVAAKIRDLRPPEPYLGKGIRYSDETIRRKAGKAAGK
ncbi:MAG: 50S ribosomal protein L6 [Bdellovibrionales bacterium]